MKRSLFLLLLSIFSVCIFGQVGVNTNTPNLNSSLDINSKSGTKGVMLPHINKVQEASLASSLVAADKGLAFYNTDTDCVITWKGTMFSKLCEQGKAEFTVNCTSSSVEGAYRVGKAMTNAEYLKLSINVTKEGPYDISGTTGNGYYFSSTGYLTVGSQNLFVLAFGYPASEGVDSVVVKDNLSSADLCSYNITVLSGMGILEITPAQCSSITPPTLVVGNSNQVDVNVPVTISLTGPVSLETQTLNNVMFNANNNFVSTGVSSINMVSNGTPEAVGTYNYTIDGTSGTPCSFNVNVIASTIEPNPSVTSVKANGSYVATVDLSAQESVSATGVSFVTSTGGSYGLGIRYVTGGKGNPGLQFNNQTGTLPGAATTQTISLLFPATMGTIPASAGTYTYELYDIYTNLSLTPQFQIVVSDRLGGFGSPATNCQAIFNEYNTASDLLFDDGEYWIGTSDTNKYLTRCDMVSSSEATAQGKKVGGYTLVWSYSEKTNLTTYNINGANKFSQRSDQTDWKFDNASVVPRNLVTKEGGSMNYYNFRITYAEAQRLGASAVARIRYTVSPTNTDSDAYGDQNYLETSADVNWVGGGEKLYGAPAYGKYKGYDFSITGGTGPCGLTMVMNGQTKSGFCIYGNDGYGWHLDVNNNFSPGSTELSINNMWGFFGENEHDTAPFGKCTNPTNMTVNSVNGPGCNGDVAGARVQHPGINGDEGYVAQWWIK